MFWCLHRQSFDSYSDKVVDFLLRPYDSWIPAAIVDQNAIVSRSRFMLAMTQLLITKTAVGIDD